GRRYPVHHHQRDVEHREGSGSADHLLISWRPRAGVYREGAKEKQRTRREGFRTFAPPCSSAPLRQNGGCRYNSGMFRSSLILLLLLAAALPAGAQGIPLAPIPDSTLSRIAGEVKLPPELEMTVVAAAPEVSYPVVV